MEEQQFQTPPPVIKKGMSTGAAIVLGISGIIIAVIIAAAILVSKGINTVKDFDFESLDGLEFQVDDNGESTQVNIEVPASNNVVEQNVYTGLAFSVVLPQGVTAGDIQQAEGGPYQSITFSDGTVFTSTTNLTFDDQYGTFPFTASTEMIGDNTFFVSHAMGGRTHYGLETGGRRYQIYQDSQSQIDLSTLEVN